MFVKYHDNLFIIGKVTFLLILYFVLSVVCLFARLVMDSYDENST